MNLNFNENYFIKTNELKYNTFQIIEELSQSNIVDLDTKICIQEQSTSTDEIIEQKTDEIIEILKLKEEIKQLIEKNSKLNLQIATMKYDNKKIKQNYNELLQLVMLITKLDINNPDIDIIRNKLTILVNREIRLKYVFPFTNIFSKILK